MTSREMTQEKRRSQEALKLYMELKFLRPGITQEEMKDESGLSRSTIQRMSKGGLILIGYYDIFERYVAQYRADVWPQSSSQIKELRDSYLWFEKQSTKVFRRWIDSVDGLLQSSTHLHGNPTFDTVFVLWLLAWIAYDRAYTLKQNEVTNRDLALARLDLAVDHLDVLMKDSYRPADQELLSRLKVMRFATYFNSRPASSRTHEPEVIDWLSQANFITSVRHLCDSAPYDWSLIRNGLIASCVLQDKDSCEDFYQRLVHADSRFSEPTYAPNNGKVQSIKDDSDCRFFVDYCLDDIVSSSCMQPPREATKTI